jgi:hypothetical protein
MLKFLPFSFVIYCLYEIIINETDGFVVLLTCRQCRDQLSHQLASKYASGGPHFTNLRFIIIGPSDFDKKIQTLDNYFPLNHSHILLLIGLWEGKIVFS